MNISSRYPWFSVFPILVLGVVGCANKRAPTAATPPKAQTKETITMVPTPTSGPRPLPTPEVRAVEFSSDRKYLAVGTLQPTDPIGGTIAVRDCATNRVVKSWKVTGGVRFLKFSPDGKNIAATGAANTLQQWNWKDGRLLHTTKLDVGENVGGRTPLDYAPDGRTIAIAGNDIQLFDTRTWKSRTLNVHPVSIGLSYFLAFSPDGRQLLISDGDEGFLGSTICSVPDGKARQRPNFMPYTAPVFARDGRQFAETGNDFKSGFDSDSNTEGVFVFDARTLKIKRKFTDRNFMPLDFSPDGKFLVGVRDSYDFHSPSPIEIWNIARGKRAQRFAQTARAVVWLDGKTLLAGDENGVRKLRVKRK